MLFWREVIRLLIAVQIRERDPMNVAQHMVIHAVVEEERSKLMRLSSDVDIVGRKVQP